MNIKAIILMIAGLFVALWTGLAVGNGEYATAISIAGLTEEGSFTANENIKVTLNNEHPFINQNHNLGGQLPHQVSAQIVVLGHVVAETQLTQDFELGNMFEFDYNALMESILGIVDINLEDLTVTEAAINDALASDASLTILSMDEFGEVLNSQEYAFSLEQGVNAITPLTGASETFLDAVVGENASGSINFQLNVSSSDHGATPVIETFDVSMNVLRIADQTNVTGIFYTNLTSTGVDVVTSYFHADQDGSESLTIDLFVDYGVHGDQIAVGVSLCHGFFEEFVGFVCTGE